MKISLILQPKTTDWQGNIIRELMALRHEVLINNCEEDCDVILAMTHTMWPAIQDFHKDYPNIPLVTLNWDWYHYIDKTIEGWPEFIELMKDSVDVWTSSKAEADKCEKETGIKSDFYTYAFVLPWEWEEGENKDLGFIFQASRKDKNKRFHWFIQAAEKLNIPFKKYHPHENSRMDYINTMKNCAFWVLASREESIGGLGTMEAALCEKPCLISDCAGNKEVWGDDVWYFDKDSSMDFTNKMRWLWENRDSQEVSIKVKRAKKRVEDRFMPIKLAERMSERLKKIL